MPSIGNKHTVNNRDIGKKYNVLPKITERERAVTDLKSNPLSSLGVTKKPVLSAVKITPESMGGSSNHSNKMKNLALSERNLKKDDSKSAAQSRLLFVMPPRFRSGNQYKHDFNTFRDEANFSSFTLWLKQFNVAMDDERNGFKKQAVLITKRITDILHGIDTSPVLREKIFEYAHKSTSDCHENRLEGLMKMERLVSFWNLDSKGKLTNSIEAMYNYDHLEGRPYST